MSITEEDGGRLNAFAKEPQIEVVSTKASYGKTFRGLALVIILLILSVIVRYMT